MGFDNIIENDKEWKSSSNYVLIKNNICKTMKKINDSLKKHINEKKKIISLYLKIFIKIM